LLGLLKGWIKLIKIAIVEDQSLLREMLAKVLSQEERFEVTGCLSDGRDVIKLCEETNPDVILLDIKMPNMDGIHALSKIKERFPKIKCIMLTTFEEEKYIYPALANGADGYIIKDIKPDALIHMIQSVYDGLFVVYDSIKEYILLQMQRSCDEYKRLSLSTKELDFDSTDLIVLKLLTRGKSNSEIASEICYSEGTVKNRISRMLEMTGTKDRTQLAIFALQSSVI